MVIRYGERIAAGHSAMAQLLQAETAASRTEKENEEETAANGKAVRDTKQ